MTGSHKPLRIRNCGRPTGDVVTDNLSDRLAGGLLRPCDCRLVVETNRLCVWVVEDREATLTFAALVNDGDQRLGARMFDFHMADKASRSAAPTGAYIQMDRGNLKRPATVFGVARRPDPLQFRRHLVRFRDQGDT